MSKLRIPSEFAFQVLALLGAVIVVHAFYVGLIRPSADAQLAAQTALQASGAAFVPERSLYVVIRDFEQEACFILMIWALAIMGLKAWTTRQEATMLEQNLIQVTEGTTLLPQDARNYARGIEALPEAEQEQPYCHWGRLELSVQHWAPLSETERIYSDTRPPNSEFPTKVAAP